MNQNFAADTAPGTAPGQARLTNMGLAYRALADCMEAGESSPRLGILYGFSGYGKTVAAAFAAAQTGAAYISARSVWTEKTLLRALVSELSITRPKRLSADLLDQVIDELARAPRPIIIDEMDHLVKRQAVEIIRDIHDATASAILMIGEEALPAKLKEWERFDNRVLVAVAAQPASEDDALRLRDHYCRAITVSDDLVLYIRERCKGVTRRISVNLQLAQREAMLAGIDSVDRAWWGNRTVLTGEIATRRSMAGAF